MEPPPLVCPPTVILPYPPKKRPPTYPQPLPTPTPLKPVKSLHLLPTVTARNDPRGSSEITNRSRWPSGGKRSLPDKSPASTSPEETPRKMVEMEIYRRGLTSAQGTSPKDPFPVLSEETLTRTSGGQVQQPTPPTVVPINRSNHPNLTSPEEAPRKMVEMEIYRRGLTSTQGPTLKEPFTVLSEETLTRTSGGQAQQPPPPTMVPNHKRNHPIQSLHLLPTVTAVNDPRGSTEITNRSRWPSGGKRSLPDKSPASTSPEEAPRKMVEIEIYRRVPVLSGETLTRTSGGQAQQPPTPTVVPNHKSNHPNPTSPEEAPRKMVEMEIYRRVTVLSEETITRTSGGQAHQPLPPTVVPNHKSNHPNLTSPEEAPRKMVEMEIYHRGLTSTQGPTPKDPC
ncbi:proteoglycan 4-like [Palaemon carinicauda]|uniref:proteoglycan 4-like n=1 Tax=Palaemon carinicauda TaxID=392227 RepID=UPI0035B68A5E